MTKYGAVPTEVDGHRFPSRREAARYQELRLLESAEWPDAIRNLRLQVTHRLVVNGVLVCKYISDFEYDEQSRLHVPPRSTVEWLSVVEDCKGFKTKEYRLKAKLLLALEGTTIRET